MTGRSKQISDAMTHQATADDADCLFSVLIHLFPRANKTPELRSLQDVETIAFR
jgi:hypothetical protein